MLIGNVLLIGNGHKYKDKYRQTPPPQSLTELKVENDPEDLNLNSLGKTSGPCYLEIYS